jgi:membrane-associated protein
MEAVADFLTRLYRFDELIRWGGYLVLVAIVFAETGLLVGFFLPGDSLLVTAGLVAAAGELQIGWLILLLSAAAIAGDSTGYAIGYHVGSRLFRRKESLFFRQEYVTKTQRFYEKYGAKTIVIARFVPIIRTFAPTMAGVGKMAYRTFVTFNILGGMGWVTSMTLAGFWLGASIPNIERHLHWVIGIVILLSLMPILREWLHYRRRRFPVSR